MGVGAGGAAARRPIVLVGKGVCFDTGGINVKPAGAMKTMKGDMAGSAAALGTFLALRHTRPYAASEVWLALAENNINPDAFRPDEVVTAVTGTTIEVVHSDAEGRMLLADTLALAGRTAVVPALHHPCDAMGEPTPPRVLLDFATLTGAVVTALSTRYVGVFTNRPEFAPAIIETGEQCGERAWPFPVDSDFLEELQKSEVADLFQCLPTGEADHIYAAAFLGQFVKPAVPWLHLDLASAHR
ncbi:hypothetical protein B484DRAFT_327873 [Ochromonadaceae sp. CCMP2298]|nr:hypothetical protein B484DRAFT_327873 [Ochromonadaceae sp. CCMP2298]